MRGRRFQAESSAKFLHIIFSTVIKILQYGIVLSYLGAFGFLVIEILMTSEILTFDPIRNSSINIPFIQSAINR